MDARSLFRARFLRDELHQEAFFARFTVLRVEVHASGRILENEPWPPGFTRQSPVTALLQKLQFELQYFKQVTTIFRHNAHLLSLV